MHYHRRLREFCLPVKNEAHEMHLVSLNITTITYYSINIACTVGIRTYM